MKKFVYSMLTFVLAVGGACAAQSDQPSLGELAKKHRLQEKNLINVKVLTNDDVASVTPDTQARAAKAESVLSAAPASSSQAAAKNPDKAKDNGKSPAATKETPEVAELKQKLSSYKQEQDGWKQSAKKYEDLLANETSDFRRQMYEDALQGDQQNVQTVQEKIDQTQTDLAKAENPSSH
jgi:hypothetical protein